MDVHQFIERFNALSDNGKIQLLAEMSGMLKALGMYEVLEDSLKAAEKKK